MALSNLPVEWGPAKTVLSERTRGILYITVNPETVAPAVLETVDTLIAVGDEPGKTIDSFCKAVGSSSGLKAEVTKLPPGDVLLYKRRESATVLVHSEKPTTERKRHSRKYAEGNLGSSRSFYFRGPEGKLNLKAHNLEPVSGTILPIHVTCTPLPFAVDLLFVTISDLTQKRSNQQLRDTIKQRDEFIHALEHELRNPLAPLRNAIAILKIKGVPDPDMQWALGVIDRQVGMMNRLLDKLLDVSRLRSGKITMHKTRLDATIIMAKAVKSVRSLMDGRKQELTVALPPKPIWVHADASLLEQILTNLLTSAAKNTRDGGQICLIAEEHGPDVVIKVRDSGNGHTPEALARIFEPYVPVAEAAESKSGDLEIGLTTARGLVELHGGRIHAQSEGLGKGTEFVIQLPLQQGN